ncbi:multicopper oxidase family protein [Nitrosomonas sp. JL21]|uniref:multicopper oxidase domain-containing protein n=1 Tax=Nitrosomonas sp. JL21 TaxID=153949 RepID=UPI001369D227|nr:multicopper oxidase domain-containing protein [Nitrosomonas sp. JL21]MBL8497591.1 multicopper oxidase domain-containing protein [Nitrosomonas sp.]MXS77811.1 multicopper oxidase family protein [Nitrosomonas sp. JL21]
MTHFDYSRRQFLHYAAAGTLAASLPGFIWADTREVRQIPNPAFKADVEIALTAQAADVSIRPGPHTHVFKYHGKLLKGPQEALTVIPGYLGPILNFQQGQKVRIFFYNELPEPCVTHWHGMHVPQIMDGHPMYAIRKGEQYVYEFEVKNPAGTNWYHAHTHELTATQVYQGLTGLITISDEHEQKLELPSGEYEIPLIIQDRSFTNGNQLRYVLGMHQRMTGFLGDTLLVNGQENSTIPVKSRAYRVRVLNGSNARIYKLGWNDGTPMTAIGTDGGLLHRPETLPYIMLAPAERVELWVDFSGRKIGSDLILQSLPYQGSMHRGMRGMRGGMGGMGQDDTLTIAHFHIAEQVGDSPKLPTELVPMRRLTRKDASNPDKIVPIAIGMRHMAFQLNGRTFDMLNYQAAEKIPVNTIQRIRIFHENRGMGRGMRGGMGGMGMMMSQPHPIHLHGQQFQIVSRRQNNRDEGYDSVKEGFIDSGWKDTVLVMPGEEVEIIKPFNDYTGLFLYHCHNLEHEDMGMMRNFFVS